MTNKTDGKSPMTLEDAGHLLRRFQLNEWALDKRVTKKALKEQRKIVQILLVCLTWRDVTIDELDHVIGSMN